MLARGRLLAAGVVSFGSDIKAARGLIVSVVCLENPYDAIFTSTFLLIRNKHLFCCCHKFRSVKFSLFYEPPYT
jgi:hypothetical protein